MRVELGDKVSSSDAVDMGRIKHLILDPVRECVAAVVLEKGALLPDDVVAPLDDLTVGPQNDTRLKYKAEELRDLPRFDESAYTAADSGAADRAGYLGRIGGLLVPVGIPYTGTSTIGLQGAFPYFAAPGDVTGTMPIASVETGAEPPRERSEPCVVIEEGAEVVSADGHKVGVVRTVAFDTVTGRPISLTVRRGIVFTQEIEIAGEDIGAVESHRVDLTLTKAEFDSREPLPRRQVA